jgi:hypothetical protein
MINLLLESYNIEILEQPIKIYYFKTKNKREILGHIIPILYDDTFFNITQSNEEFSLFVSSNIDLSKVPELVSDNKEYNVIQINYSYHQIDDVGVVHEISKIFNSLNIPILYINSFNNNFILIPKNNIIEIEKYINSPINTQQF